MEIGYDDNVLGLEGCSKDDEVGGSKIGRVLGVWEKKNDKELLGWLWKDDGWLRKGSDMPRTVQANQHDMVQPVGAGATQQDMELREDMRSLLGPEMLWSHRQRLSAPRTGMSHVVLALLSDSGSIVVVLSSGGVAPADPGAADALAAMRSFLNVDSTVTTRRLMEVRKNYFVPPEYELNTLLLGERPYNAFPSGFSLSIDALEAGLKFPLYSCDLGVPREVANLSFPDGAQLVMLSGGFPVGMLWKDEIRRWGGQWIGSSINDRCVCLCSSYGSTAEKHPSVDKGSSLRKHSRRVTPKQLIDASRSTTRVLT
ncbi:hypothetical protein BHM03_00002202 [Ensete ventricosum]|nr:hypothetical protein BHM03_00002202 [Ensete ventricosum]